MYRSLTGSPHARSRSYQPDWAVRRPLQVPVLARPGGGAADLARSASLLAQTSRRTHHAADAVHDGVQRAGGRDPGVFLPQRAGRGVPRVGEGRLAGLLEGLVQPLERGLGQEDLAAHLQDLGHVVSGKAGGYRRDRLDVERHVLTGPPVPPGGRPGQPAPLVHQVDGQPVDLQLAQVRPGPAELGRPVCPGAELLGGEHVIQAEQPLQVLHRIEQRRERAADLLRRRVRRAQLGELFLDLVECAYVAVVLGVGDRRRVQHVVAVLRLRQLLAQLGVPPPAISRTPGSTLRSTTTPSPPSSPAGCLPPPGTTAAPPVPARVTPRPARRRA